MPTRSCLKTTHPLDSLLIIIETTRRIGNNVIIGAGSVVAKDIQEDSLALGNPARVIGSTHEYILKHKMKVGNQPTYNKTYTMGYKINNLQKEKMVQELKSGMGYVE